MVEITSEEQNKVKRMKRTEDSLRHLWNNIKCTNIRIIGVPEEKEKRKVYEKTFEEIIIEKLPNMEKEKVNQVQEAQRVPYRINPRRNMPVQLSLSYVQQFGLQHARPPCPSPTPSVYSNSCPLSQ